MAYLYNGVLFSFTQEWGTDTCHNVNDPWKHAKWKGPDTKGHNYDSICMKYPEWVSLQR